MLASHLPIANAHQCKTTGVIGDFMELPGAKLEIVKAWAQGKRETPKPDPDAELSAGNDEGVREEEESIETSRFQTEKANMLDDNASISTTGITSIADTSTARSRASSSTTNEAVPDLAQLKLRVAALRTRTERLLSKVRGRRPPTLG
ncbi:hypothetical protein CLAIMM_05123 [Cladophialophora immunda]|nr:hypothetical protein CLAIMM_05123 [Cladophialophora immunda]